MTDEAPAFAAPSPLNYGLTCFDPNRDIATFLRTTRPIVVPVIISFSIFSLSEYGVLAALLRRRMQHCQ